MAAAEEELKKEEEKYRCWCKWKCVWPTNE
jgi:hypothetical protein